MPSAKVRLMLAVCLLTLAVLGCGGGSARPGTGTDREPDGQQAGNGANIVRFERWQISDPMADNNVALRYLVPAGWQSRGQVVWQPQWARLADLQTRVADPVSGAAVEWLPAQDFIFFPPPAGLPAPPIGGSYQGKAYVPPVTDPAQFVADFWMPGPLAHLTGATLTNVREVPQVAQEFVRQFGGPATAGAYTLRYSYTVNGQPWDEDVFLALLYASGNGIDSWYVNFAYTVRAPQGVLDAMAPTLSTIVASRTTTPEWEAVYRLTKRLFVQGIQQQMADTQAFGQLLAQHRAETQALQQQVAAERQASQDLIADMRGEVLAGVQTFVDPQTQQLVQLPAGQGTYWVNERGEYVASDQSGFDPASLGGTWTRLQPR